MSDHEVLGPRDAYLEGERDMRAMARRRAPEVVCYGGPCDGRKVRVPRAVLERPTPGPAERTPPPFEMPLTLPSTVALDHLPIERRPLAMYRLDPEARVLRYVRTETLA